MSVEQLIGKPVLNYFDKRGIIADIDKEGRFLIDFDGEVFTYVKDAFDRGYLKFDSVKSKQRKSYKKRKNEEIKECFSELNSLIGLNNIKERIQDLVCEINISKLRFSYGLKCPEISKHMVFVGNPGTGKTTVARIISKIYKTLGVLSRGQLVEVDRSSLVAGFQGQTALKTKEAVTKAIGGTLFIDEAYSICRDSDDDYGNEALNTLVKEIEDHRDDMMVIVAGYKDEMDKFLETNPGLRSRFKTTINFDDYSGDELYLILKNLVIENDYVFTEEADQKVKTYLLNKKTLSGNGRTVRNSFEEIIRYQSRRLNSLDRVNKKQLMTIEADDIQNLDMVS